MHLGNDLSWTEIQAFQGVWDYRVDIPPRCGFELNVIQVLRTVDYFC